MIDVELYCIEENGTPITFILQPDVIIGYETCAWSNTGKRTIIRLTFDSYHEWIIDPMDKTAVHIVSNIATGIIRTSYKFVKLIIK
jgi:hypothetical protein